MKRTPQEMTDMFRKVIASQSEDDIASFLEDINDSVDSPVDLSGWVEKSEYDARIAERDEAIRRADDYRDRYINRFYNPGNATNDITIVEGGAPQLEIEKEEKRYSYDMLFE